MRYLHAEFHCHVKLFGNGTFRPSQLRHRLNWANRLGLDILALTEHFDVPDFWDICGCIKELCHNDGEKLNWRGTVVLTGAEVSVYDGGDILLIGSLTSLKELENRLGCISLGNFPWFKNLLDASEDLGFLRIGAHPCRPDKELWKFGPLLNRLDALEINATELSMAGWVKYQAKAMNIPVVAGSDAHHWAQIGRVYNLSIYYRLKMVLRSIT